MSASNKKNYIVVLVTTSTEGEAEKIAKALLTAREAACINIVKNINSLFNWQGKMQKAKEALLIIKSRKSLLKKLITTVKKHHSYTVPEVIALPIIGGDKSYLEWVSEVT